jgi:hypothetical protein
MPAREVTQLHPRPPTAYTDTAALNDIHALVTAGDPGDGALADIAQILARTGRPMTPVRDIEISATETALGWPVACVRAGDTSVFIRQSPAGPSLLIEIYAKTDAERDGLAVTLDGCPLLLACPAGSDPA